METMLRLILVCLLLKIIDGSTIDRNSPITQCPDGWRTFGNNCFLVFGGKYSGKLSWTAAAAECRNHGGYLASIHSQDEQDFLVSYSLNVPDRNVWIGAHDSKIKDLYQWDDNSPMDYTSWGPKEPSEPKNGVEDCVELKYYDKKSNLGKWNDAPCEGIQRYLCELKLGPEDSEPVTTDCKDGWYYFGSKCFAVFGGKYSGKLTWTEAAEQCRKYDSHLASIHSREEQDFLARYSLNIPDTNVWIGLNDRRIKDLYEWDDKSPMNYTNWDSDQPSEPKHGVEDCGEMRYNTDKSIIGTWNDASCDMKSRYVCEAGREPQITEPPREVTIMGCEDGWLYFQEKCYKGFGDSEFDRETWDDAQNMCTSLNGNLVSIRDQTEEDFVFSHILMLLQTDDVWIGLNDRNKESLYHWTDNSSFEYANWKIGEPSGYANEKEDCVEYYYCNDLEAIWNDCPCDKNFGFICKKEPDVPLLTPPADATECKNLEGWHKFRNSCFKQFFESDEGKTWDDAEDECKTYGGHLATIKDTQDHLFLKTLLRDNIHSMWIGLRKYTNRYEWSSGNIVSFTKWSGTPEEACVFRKSNGEWDTFDCSKKSHFICEILPEPVLPKSPGRCPLQPPDWIDLGTDYCYYIPRDTYVTWDKAHLDCTRRGGRLATIRSQEEHDILKKYLVGYPSWKGIYIGMYRDYEGNFQWLDGSPVTFQNWDEGQPNDDTELCVSMTTQERTWHDYSCSDKFGYICEIEKEVDRERNCSETPSTEDMSGIEKSGSLIQELPYMGCKEGWLYFENKCYKGVYDSNVDRETWDRAEQKCLKMEGNLVSIHSQDEQDFVFLHVLLPMQTDNVWIGLNDKLSQSQYTWSDGSAFQYTNWKSESINGEKDCVEYYYYNDYEARWNEISCNEEYGYICKGETVPSSTLPPDVRRCSEPEGWYKFRNSCFKQFTETDGEKTWHEAEHTCMEYGGHLATIKDTKDHLFLKTLLRDNIHSMWIGLRNTGNRYEWSSGNIVSFTKWSATPEEPCVFRKTDGKWDTFDCSKKFSFICEILPDPILPKNDGRCPVQPSDWIDLGTDYCYYVALDTYVTWGKGELECRRRGGTLVTIHSQEEHDILEKYLVGYPSWKNIYIGMYRDYEGNFQWLDGSPVTFQNWDEGQPNDEDEVCTAMLTQERIWHDYGCSENYGYICKRNKDF